MTSDDRELHECALAAMRLASERFYMNAFRGNVHAFIEFTGLLNEYINMCQEAYNRGEPFLHANVHTGEHLKMQPYQRKYVAEKLECIFGTANFEGSDGG